MKQYVPHLFLGQADLRLSWTTDTFCWTYYCFWNKTQIQGHRHVNGNRCCSCTWSHAWSTNKPVKLERWITTTRHHGSIKLQIITFNETTKNLTKNKSHSHHTAHRGSAHSALLALPSGLCSTHFACLVLSMFSLMTACSTSQPPQCGGQCMCPTCVGE